MKIEFRFGQDSGRLSPQFKARRPRLLLRDRRAQQVRKLDWSCQAGEDGLLTIVPRRKR